uniref:Tyrosine-protein phosphatase domain-containing protein n=1 Tax=Caenorhabditis tropicalis TaxID=1561998 RepID=A0A1I7TQF1_9PELO
MDSKKKLNALDTLIASVSDPNSLESRLEETKRTLGHLNSLDLRFSYHSQVLQKTSKAIDDLFAFLTDFSADQLNANDGTIDSESDEEYPVWIRILIIVAIVIGGIVVLAVIGGIYWFFFKFLRKDSELKKLKSLLQKFIRVQKFPAEGYAEAHRYHESALRAAKIHRGKPDGAASLEYLPAKKHRPASFAKRRRKMPIHANKITCPLTGKVFYPTQAPLAKTATTDDTREDFWHMGMQDEVEVYVCLIHPGTDEVAPFYPSEVNGEMTCGRFKLKTNEGTTVYKKFEDMVYRRIEITDTTKKFKTRVITLLNITSWQHMRPPRDLEWEPVHAVLEECKKTTKPVVVVSLYGNGRAMSLIGMQFVRELIQSNPKGTIGEGLNLMFDARYDAIETLRQCFWLQLAVCQKLNKDFGLKMEADLEEMHNLAMQVCFHDRGPPDFEKERARINAANEEIAGTGIVLVKKPEETDNLGELIPY